FITPAATGAVNEADHTIAITVSYCTDVTALALMISQKGRSVSLSSGDAQDFTNPVAYTVTAADTTTQSYVVTVTVAASPAKAITDRESVAEGETVAVHEGGNTQTINVTYGTEVRGFDTTNKAEGQGV